MEEKRTPRLILLSEFLDQNKRKEDEIIFYEKELKKIEEKLYWLRREKDLTETIINIISQEKVVDIREEMEKKMLPFKKHFPVCFDGLCFQCHDFMFIQL